jgi:hypothetical protein
MKDDLSIQEIVARVYKGILDLQEKGEKPTWVILHAQRYRELQVWHRRLGELPAGDYIDEEHLFDIPIAIDNSYEYAILDAQGKPIYFVPRKGYGTNS